MNTFIWIGVAILLLGWIGLMIISLFYKFEEDRIDSLDLKSLPNNCPDNPSKTGKPNKKHHF
jgi:hypothetical protein